MIRNIVCAILVLCAAELNRSYGRHVNDVVIDQSDDVRDQTGVLIDPPDVVIDRPGVLIDKKDIVIDQPDVVFDPREVVIDPPGVVFDPKDIAIDQHDVVFDPREVVIDPPGVVFDPKDVVIDQADTVVDLPDVVINQAFDVHDELSSKNNLPAPTELDDSEVMNDNAISLSRKKRKAINDPNRRWSHKQIPYAIDHQFNYEAVNLILQAINVWQEYTCLRFRPRYFIDRNYITFINGEGCYSNVGMVGGPQEVSLNIKDCINLNTITHELGHAVGFYHENNRPDRDQFVTIFKENAKDEYRNLYEISYDIDNYGVPYDYKSLMHYSGDGGASKNGKPVIQTKDPYFQDIIGKANGLSFNDIKLANLMYRCNQNCAYSPSCPNSGFQGQDCQCWCEGNPVKRC